MYQNKAILDIFQNFRSNPLSIDQFEEVGKPILDSRISKFTDAGKPIEFSMMGVPFKSMNDRDKVLGKLPDLGEHLMVLQFKRMNDMIKTVYEPGIVINMVSDGYMFNDLMDVPDGVVAAYQEVLEDMTRDSPIRILNAIVIHNNGQIETIHRKDAVAAGYELQHKDGRPYYFIN